MNSKKGRGRQSISSLPQTSLWQLDDCLRRLPSLAFSVPADRPCRAVRAPIAPHATPATQLGGSKRMVLTDPRHPAANEFSAMPDMGRGGAGVSLRPLMKGVLTQSRRVRRGADASGGGGRKLLLLFSANPAALREEWFLHDLAGIGFSETRRPILRSTPNSRVFRSVSSTAV